MPVAAFPTPNISLTLRARTAADLMTPNPLSLRDNASLKEAIAFLVDKGISGAPVIDVTGRPVGVLSQSDVLVHDRQKVEYVNASPEEFVSGSRLSPEVLTSFQVEKVDRTPVRDLMTPAVFTISLDSPATMVIEEMLAFNVHRLFVVDRVGVMVGVITALDVLRHLEVPPR